VYIGLSGTVVASFDRVIKQPEYTVAVIGIVLGSVDTSLGSNTVGPPRTVVKGVAFDRITQLPQ
jgi:hypothetical protein